MDALFNSLLKKVESCGQQHLLKFWKDLDVGTQVEFGKQILSLNLDSVESLFNQAQTFSNNDGIVKCIDDEMIGSSESPIEDLSTWRNLGYEAIRNNEVAIILLAGGQGTRLGSDKPKALFDVGLPSKKTLLELQAERIKKLEELYQGEITWYIMASPATFEPLNEAVEGLIKVGLDMDRVKLFSQGVLPCLSEQGNILLREKGLIATNPDGNGGLYKALHENDIVNDMESRGIKHVFMYCVDNILVKVGDPEFIGFCISKDADCGNKVVLRASGESVGVTCLLDGKPGVIEYTEMPNEIRESTMPNGELVYGAANVCIHYFNFRFLSEAVKLESSMPVHLARKKIPCISDEGHQVNPEQPNGVKLEKFVFDVFRFVDPTKFVMYKCRREEEFAPLKNAVGNDGTPNACREALCSLHARWLLKAGAELVSPDGEISQSKSTKVAEVEVSPKVSYGGEGLDKLVGGKLLSWPLHLTENKQYF